MATFESDADGFLVGSKLLESSHQELQAQDRALPVWREIRSDVRSIARQLGVQVSAAKRGNSAPRSSPRSAPTSAVEPVGRRGSTRTAGGRPQAAPLIQRDRATRVTVALPNRDARGQFLPKTIAAAVDDALRDQRGRFTSPGSKAPDAEPGGTPANKRERGDGLRASEALQRIGAALHQADNLDPTLNAAKEIKEAVVPLGRGLGGLFGRNAERKKERWYQRILSALGARGNGERKSAAPAAAAGGGLLSGLGGGLAGGLLGGASGLIGRGAGLVGGLAMLGLRGGAGLLKRLPILGALLSGGMVLGGAFGMNDDPSKSAEENRAMRYRSSGESAGMGVGGLIGGALGSLLGPVGTAGGAWLGSLIGEKIGGALGDWTKELVDAKVPDKVVAYVGAAWDSITTDLKATWASVSDKVGQWADTAKSALQSVGDTISGAAGTANKWFKDKTGVDVGATAKSAWDATKGAVSSAAGAAVDFAKENASKLVPETVKRAAAAGDRAVSSMLGINKVLETGAGYNVVQRGDGSVVRQDGARNWRNNNPGNIEYGDFAIAHGAVGSDGRFAVFPSYEVGRAAQESLFFQGKNYRNLKLSDAIARYAPPGENNTPAYQAAALAAVGGQDKLMSEYGPAERRAILDAKQRHEGYKVGTVTTQVGSRAPLGVAVPVGPAVMKAGVPTLSPSDVPKAAEVKAAPVQLNTDRDGKWGTVTVRIPETLSQDVGDRSLAHIVSGGI